MFKKLLIASAILAASSTMAFANAAPYVAAGLGINTNTASSSNFRGVTGTVGAGYGATINQSIYLGGEGFVNLFTGTVSSNAVGSNTTRTTYGFGLSAMPGVMLSDHTMTFLRAGLVRTHFSNLSATKTGGQVGLGMQTSVTQNWDMRGEYDYTRYSSISTNSDQFNLSLVYKFE